jgi:hypothetical protein
MVMHRLQLGALLAGCAFIAACSGPNAQVLQYQTEKEQLTEVIRSQREANKTLQERADSLAHRLDEAEKELAIAQGRGTRLSRSQPASSAAPSTQSAPIREPAAKSAPATTAKSTPEDKLLWRPSRTGSRPTAGSENR